LGIAKIIGILLIERRPDGLISTAWDAVRAELRL
jgi:hypothetical protein